MAVEVDDAWYDAINKIGAYSVGGWHVVMRLSSAYGLFLSAWTRKDKSDIWPTMVVSQDSTNIIVGQSV